MIPPIISFALGSLGYLCAFEKEEYQEVLDKNLFSDRNFSDHNQYDKRVRLTVQVNDKHLRRVFQGGNLYDAEEINIDDFHIMNEVVIDRGPSPYSI